MKERNYVIIGSQEAINEIKNIGVKERVEKILDEIKILKNENRLSEKHLNDNLNKFIKIFNNENKKDLKQIIKVFIDEIELDKWKTRDDEWRREIINKYLSRQQGK